MMFDKYSIGFSNFIDIDNKKYKSVFTSRWYDLKDGWNYKTAKISPAVYGTNIAVKMMDDCLVNWNKENYGKGLLNTDFSRVRVVIVSDTKCKMYCLYYQFSTIIDESVTVYCFSIMAKKIIFLMTYALDFVAKYTDGFFDMDDVEKNLRDCGYCTHDDCCSCPEFDQKESLDIKEENVDKD